MKTVNSLLIICLLLACTDKKRTHENTIANETLIEIIQKEVLPMLRRFEADSMARVLDSLQPLVNNSSPNAKFNWSLAKSSEKIVRKDYDSAKWFIVNAMDEANKTDSISQNVIKSKIRLATLYSVQKNWDSVISVSHEALYLCKEVNMRTPLELYSRLCECYLQIGDYANAMKFARKGFDSSESDPQLRAAFANAIAINYQATNQIDSAEHFLKFVQADPVINPVFKAVQTHSLGISLIQRNKIPEGLSYMYAAKPILQQMNLYNPESYYALAYALAKSKKYTEASRCLDSVDLIRETPGASFLTSDVWQLRSELLRNQGKLFEGLKAMDSNLYYRQIAYDSSLIEKARTIEGQYKTKEKDDAIAKLKFQNSTQEKINYQQKVILFALSVSIALFLLVMYLIYRRGRLRAELNEISFQQQLSRIQMEPHFLFNSLTIAQSLSKSNPGLAVEYTGKLAALFRVVLKNTRKTYVLLKDELEVLDAYLQVEVSRFENGFDYELNVYNRNDMVYIPPMILQPFIENSIKHGFTSLPYRGFLQVKIEKVQDALHCIIEDNGHGLHSSQRNGNKNGSYSIEIIRKQLELLTRRYKTQSDLRISDKLTLDDKTGVRVEIVIPIVPVVSYLS
ncbi:histidine kinase [Paraflavitalea sp. CAU 1676]|uniref:histidine kinase n=1 Tax=Paraflavitalea sp. CAU 1676 TaxID=3032598 RepID=UPI0023D9E43B|nr:histidine kinase [Paraflavitalea sp. CAU 1676]MDF2190517.1 histidine kinase [Paraflavitalea sp. CAU 1676]